MEENVLMDLDLPTIAIVLQVREKTTLPAEVENNLKFPFHMDYLVLF